MGEEKEMPIEEFLKKLGTEIKEKNL